MRDNAATMIGRHKQASAILNELLGDHRTAKRLIAVYGLGGVGKSTLVSHVQTRLPAKSAIARLDETFDGLGDGRQILAEMARQANSSAGVTNSNFKEALTRLEDILEKLIGSDSTAAARIGRLLGLSAKAAADTASGGPVSQLATEILEPFSIRADKAWQRVRTAHRIAHADVERELLDDPLGILTRAFFNDIQEWTLKHQGRFILVLDTFEVISHEIESFILTRVVPLVTSVESNVHLMISGRFPLSHHDSRWIDLHGRTILQIQILPFTLKEVEDYLETLVRPFSTGPVPTAEQLYAATAGLPFLLERWRVSGMSSRELLSSSRNTFERLTCWLNDQQRDWLCKACCPSAFDLRLLRHLIGAQADTAFAFLSRDESLCERVSGEYFSVHAPLRAAGLGQLKDTGQLAAVTTAALSHVASELKAQTERMLANKPPADGRVQWLLAELIVFTSFEEAPQLTDAMIDDLCIIAVVSPDLLASPFITETSENPVKSSISTATSVIRVLQNIGENPSAPGLKFIRSLVHDADGSVGVQLLCAIADRRTGNLRRAVAEAERAVRVRATPRTLLECAITRMLLGRFKGALVDLDAALQINAADTLCWATRGEVLRQQGEYTDSCFSFGMALGSGKVPDYVHAEYADALAQKGDLKAAESQAELACLLNPKDCWNLSIRAYVALRSGDPQVANEYFNRARAVAGEDYSRACIASLAGERNLAISLLESALENGLRTRAWARYDPDFRSLRNDPEFKRLTRSK